MLTTHLAGLDALHGAAPYRVLAFFQAQDSINSGNSRLLIIFIGITALALLTQALVVVVMGVGAMKAIKEIQGHVVELRAKAMPLIAQSHDLVSELTPKIREITNKVNSITGHVEEISALARDKAQEFSPTITAAKQTVEQANRTVQEANLKTRAQISRVDSMITSSLNSAARLGVAIEQGITKPGREVAGVISGLRAGLDTLLSGARAFGSGANVGRRPPAAPPYRPNNNVDPDF